MIRREAKKLVNPFSCDMECAIKQLKRAMRTAGPDEITNARTKAFNACTKHERQKLVQQGIPDPHDTAAQRRALDRLMPFNTPLG